MRSHPIDSSSSYGTMIHMAAREQATGQQELDGPRHERPVHTGTADGISWDVHGGDAPASVQPLPTIVHVQVPARGAEQPTQDGAPTHHVLGPQERTVADHVGHPRRPQIGHAQGDGASEGESKEHDLRRAERGVQGVQHSRAVRDQVPPSTGAADAHPHSPVLDLQHVAFQDAGQPVGDLPVLAAPHAAAVATEENDPSAAVAAAASACVAVDDRPSVHADRKVAPGQVPLRPPASRIKLVKAVAGRAFRFRVHQFARQQDRRRCLVAQPPGSQAQQHEQECRPQGEHGQDTLPTQSDGGRSHEHLLLPLFLKPRVFILRREGVFSSSTAHMLQVNLFQ
jgi:hypothetical protein